MRVYISQYIYYGMNLRTIVKKAISTGAISIIIEYVAPNSILSYFKYSMKI